jgi:hypothetical protein
VRLTAVSVRSPVGIDLCQMLTRRAIDRNSARRIASARIDMRRCAARHAEPAPGRCIVMHGRGLK